MRGWWWLGLLIGLLSVCGCKDPADTQPDPPPTSLLAFRYDAGRDVTLAVSYPLAMTTPLTGTRYANSLAMLPEVSFTPALDLRLAAPIVMLTADALTVNYREAAGLDSLAGAQAVAVLAALEAWWWTPGTREVRVSAQRQPLTVLGPLTLTQPLTRGFHTYVVQPATGEVAYLPSSQTLATVDDALETLRLREIGRFPAAQGFQPLLPANTTLTASPDRITDGVLTVDLSAKFPRADHARLAGIVLMLTQFPQVHAVRFLQDGLPIIDEPFMRGDLREPISPYQLLLPRQSAMPSPVESVPALRDAVRKALGLPPLTFGTAITWRDWSVITVTPTLDAVPTTFVLRRFEHDYRVQVYGMNLPVGQLLRHVPRDVIIALRLDGWEGLALEE